MGEFPLEQSVFRLCKYALISNYNEIKSCDWLYAGTEWLAPSSSSDCLFDEPLAALFGQCTKMYRVLGWNGNKTFSHCQCLRLILANQHLPHHVTTFVNCFCIRHLCNLIILSTLEAANTLLYLIIGRSDKIFLNFRQPVEFRPQQFIRSMIWQKKISSGLGSSCYLIVDNFGRIVWLHLCGHTHTHTHTFHNWTNCTWRENASSHNWLRFNVTCTSQPTHDVFFLLEVATIY